MHFLDVLEASLGSLGEPRAFIMPDPSAGVMLKTFYNIMEWKVEVQTTDLPLHIPVIVTDKFQRAQKLFFLCWLDFDLMKAGELVAFSALELALNDQYGAAGVFRPKKGVRKTNSIGQLKTPAFAELLRHMVQVDGLTDQDLPSVVRVNGSAVGFVDGTHFPTLAERRNGLAHGTPFEGLPAVGLLHLISDLIAYAYRNKGPTS